MPNASEIERQDQEKVGDHLLEEIRNFNAWSKPDPRKKLGQGLPLHEATDEEIAQKLNELITQQNAAPGWGAAVGERQEWITELERELERRKHNPQPMEIAQLASAEELVGLSIRALLTSFSDADLLEELQRRNNARERRLTGPVDHHQV